MESSRRPETGPPTRLKPLVKSLEQFQLGDGGGPGYLIAWNLNRYFEKYPNMKPLIDLWFASYDYLTFFHRRFSALAQSA